MTLAVEPAVPFTTSPPPPRATPLTNAVPGAPILVAEIVPKFTTVPGPGPMPTPVTAPVMRPPDEPLAPLMTRPEFNWTPLALVPAIVPRLTTVSVPPAPTPNEPLITPP